MKLRAINRWLRRVGLELWVEVLDAEGAAHEGSPVRFHLEWESR